MHRSDIGETSLNQEYIRDIQIIQMIDGKEIQVCYMFPYYEDNEPKDFPVKFPVKMVLDNTNNDFEKSSKQTVSICFAIDIEDAAFLDYMFQHFG